MQMYLIRHAHAVAAEEDAGRPLSTRGRNQVRTLARFLNTTAEFQPEQIWASPLVRAQETATRLGLKAKLVIVPQLETSAGVAVLAAKLRKTRRSLALVGHEPHLSALASLLLAGAEEPPLLALKKGAVVALDRTGARWTLRWQIFPELLKPAKSA